MSDQSLNSVAVDVVGQYALASKNLVAAYRLGTQRVATQISDRYTALVKSAALPMVDESIRSSLVAAHRQMTGFFVGGVERATEQAGVAIDRITEGTTAGIKRIGDVGQRFEAVVGAPVVETLAKLNLPAAQLSLQIAGKVAESSKLLAERVAGADSAPEAEATVEVKTAAKRAAKA